mmetsp:Transcript_11598/g.19603  ORF Transcript_11598/g.19603 Transcript_11598/m.19603 type:complete len:227 (+) Transcript_11598:280-960(+)
MESMFMSSWSRSISLSRPSSILRLLRPRAICWLLSFIFVRGSCEESEANWLRISCSSCSWRVRVSRRLTWAWLGLNQSSCSSSPGCDSSMTWISWPSPWSRRLVGFWLSASEWRRAWEMESGSSSSGWLSPSTLRYCWALARSLTLNCLSRSWTFLSSSLLWHSLRILMILTFCRARCFCSRWEGWSVARQFMSSSEFWHSSVVCRICLMRMSSLRSSQSSFAKSS